MFDHAEPAILENIWNKVKKSSKTVQEQKTLITAYA